MGLIDMLVLVLSPFIDYVASHHRPLAMVVFVLPLSFTLRVVLGLSSSIFLLFSDPAGHEKRVRRVQEVVLARQRQAPSERLPMCTARAAWQNLSTRFADYKKSSHCVYVGDLRNILELDEANQTVRLEPQCDVGTITKYLVPRGWMLACTLEIEEATIGGLAMAVGMTTASHKHGLLQETVTEWEMVLGDGRVVKATKDNEHSDLWHALPWSHGSLGFLVGITLKIVAIKPYVKVRYTAWESMAGYCRHIRVAAHEPDGQIADFVESTIYAPQRGVVMEARFADATEAGPEVVRNECSWWWKPLYFKHVENFLSRALRGEGAPSPVLAEGKYFEELIPTHSYIFRHNRAIFWTICDQLPEEICNHPLFRLCLGWMMPPKVTFLKLPATPAIREEMMTQRVYQDIVLPLRTLETAITKAGDLFGVYPILVYPSRIYDHGVGKCGVFPTPDPRDIVDTGEPSSPSTGGQTLPQYAMYYDLGVYGIPVGAKRTGASCGDVTYKHVHAMREMEEYTSSVQGAPFLYADTFMDRDEFGAMFNVGPSSVYAKCRETYGAVGNFPDVFDKTDNRADVSALLAKEKKKIQ